MKQIPLINKKGKIIDYTIVDDDLFDILNEYIWYKTAHGYAMTRYKKSTGYMQDKIWMHKFIFKICYGETVKKTIDHMDRIRLNNQSNNLRPATYLENSLNRNLGINNTTGYFGVRLDKRTKRYQVYSTYKTEWFSIGYFNDIIDAAIAHDIYMKSTYPNEFLNLNIPNATQEQIQKVINIQNNAKQRKGKSKYVGVKAPNSSIRKDKWESEIMVNKIRYKIGYFNTEEQAALARDFYAINLLGENAKLNLSNRTKQDYLDIKSIILSKKKNKILPFNYE